MVVKVKISIKKVVGVVLIGLGVYALYRFIMGEEGARRDWWCHIPVVGTIACSIPNISTLIISLVFLAVGGFFLIE